MKLRMLICGGALLILAGCASQNPYTTDREFSYTYDLVPKPVPGLTPAEMDKINELSAPTPDLYSSEAPSQAAKGAEYTGR